MSVGHTMQGGYITDRLALAAKAQRKGFTVPIYPADVEWLLESHAELVEAAQGLLSALYIDDAGDWRILTNWCSRQMEAAAEKAVAR